jgi:hypothetical protein
MEPGISAPAGSKFVNRAADDEKSKSYVQPGEGAPKFATSMP